jgi:TonB family protein
MRSQSFITVNFTTENPKQVKRETEKGNSFTYLLFTFYFSRSMSLCLCGAFLFFTSPVLAQRVAVLTPEQTPQTQKYASLLADSLSNKFKILEDSMSWAAFRSVKLESPFNLTTSQGKAIGEVVGCDYFLLVRSGTIRRSSFAKDEFYESFVTVFLVSGRSGRLIYWDLKSFEADSQVESERLLFASSGSFAGEIIEQLEFARQNGLTVVNSPAFEEVPKAGSTDAKNFRPPMPYKRIKPEYTRKAYLYDVRATVDVMVDIDQNGAIAAVAIERWAGFGIDESVIAAVRKMNWRPATRNGKTLPMRVLLRYNFTKIEKE